ncbi:MAG: hypothetical protein LHW51_04410 [Candidatus Cloacimonetes bacterium]|nr:hypothetical protein [Candidatus Cloacimonadota bacterium]
MLDSIRAGFDASRIDKAKGLEKEQVPRSAGETPAIQQFVAFLGQA